MKKYSIVLIVVAWIGIALQTQAQSTVARFKYEDAEKAFYDKDYQTCISLLDETEKLLGKSAPNILHLRIMAESKIWEADPYGSFEQLEKLRQLCDLYLKNYDILGLEDKYREVYDLSGRLPTIEVFHERVRKRTKADSIINVSGMPMAFVKGGAFIMGKNKESKYYDTTPEHKVNIHDYFIGKHEVTVAQFKVFIESTNYLTTAEQTGKSQVWDNKWRFRKNINWKHNESGEYSKENCPVVHVSYKDAVAYCQWLSKTTGGKFRLPTEAEWEYAAKGGQYTQAYKYSGSNNIDEVAWYGKNSHHEIHPVGEKQPNELDIYDMTGNVAEWCYDWYNKNYYSISPEDNPKGPPESPEEARRVIRGQDFICSFLSDDNVNWSLLIISRDCDRETQTKADIGFRVVYIPD